MVVLRTSHRRERGQVTAEYAVATAAVTSVVGGILIGPGSAYHRWFREFIADMVTRSFSLTLPDLFGWPW